MVPRGPSAGQNADVPDSTSQLAASALGKLEATKR